MRRLYVFFLLLGIWIILSGFLVTPDGKVDVAHLGMGLICCALVTWISGDLMLVDSQKSTPARIRHTLGILTYLPWLFWEILVANLHVLRLAIFPGGLQKVQPRIVRYQTYLKTPSSRFIFANSITLTPGTITLKLADDVLYIHAISEEAAEGITKGENLMERKIGRIYGELPE